MAVGAGGVDLSEVVEFEASAGAGVVACGAIVVTELTLETAMGYVPPFDAP